MSHSRTVKAGILASGNFLTTCARLITAMILSRVLSMYDYATYRQTLLAYAFVSPLLILGLPSALYYFLPEENKRPRSLLMENILLLSFMAGLFTFFLLFGGNRLLAWRFKNPDIARTLLILSPYPLFMLPVSGLSACLIARNRVKQVAVYNVLSRLLMLLIVLTAVMIYRTPASAIVGTVVGAAIVFLPALKLMFASCDVGSFIPSSNGMWSQLKYAVPLGLAGIIGTISKLLDKMIVSSMCSPEQFAVYANGAIEIPLIGVLTGSVMAILIPDLVKMHKVARYDDLIELWHRAMVKCSLMILPVMVFLFVMAPEVIRVLFSDRYVKSVDPFRVYLLALPVRITQFGAIFMAMNRNKLIVYRSTAGLVMNLFLSIILIKVLGSIGAAISTVLIVYIWAVPYNIFFTSRLLKVDFRNTIPLNILAKVFFASISAGVVFLIVPFIKHLGDILNIVIFGLLYAVVVLFLFVYLHFVDVRRMLSFIRQQLARK